jgi:DNA repair exonuclease SbcCD ATPase subunit
MATDKEKEILERIEKKILNSSVLNGGFDRLVTTVDGIKEEQKATKEKMDEIYLKLHEPEIGIYPKIQKIESDLEKIEEENIKYIIEDKKNFEELKKSVDETKDKARQAQELSDKIKQIAGNDLDSLKKIVAVTDKFSTLTWGLFGTIFIGIANFIWELYKAKH